MTVSYAARSTSSVVGSSEESSISRSRSCPSSSTYIIVVFASRKHVLRDVVRRRVPASGVGDASRGFAYLVEDAPNVFRSPIETGLGDQDRRTLTWRFRVRTPL